MDLMPDHIHIENFRLFKNLDIPKVGQVNLIIFAAWFAELFDMEEKAADV